MIYRLETLIGAVTETQIQIAGQWVPARPLPGGLRSRLRAAWMVLTGRADAFVWPEGQ